MDFILRKIDYLLDVAGSFCSAMSCTMSSSTRRNKLSGGRVEIEDISIPTPRYSGSYMHSMEYVNLA